MNSSRKIAVAIVVGLVGVAHTIGCGETKVPVIVSGCHDTEVKDRGMAGRVDHAALGMKIEVFREAFSGVKRLKDNG